MTPPPLPRHAQVASELRRRIATGVWPVGRALPSEAHLAEEFSVSRGTVRQALAALRAEGRIGGGQGKPPVVCPAPTAPSFESFVSFSAWAEDQGRRPGQRTLTLTRGPAEPAVADGLGVGAGETVVELVRLRTLDGAPAMLQRAWFVLDVGRHLFTLDPAANSLRAALLGRGVDLYAGRHTFDAVAAEPLEAQYLTVESGSPLFRERRCTTSRAGQPLEYADERYLPHLVAFTVQHTPTATGAPSWQRSLVG